jgi:hypothetical protein
MSHLFRPLWDWLRSLRPPLWPNRRRRLTLRQNPFIMRRSLRRKIDRTLRS